MFIHEWCTEECVAHQGQGRGHERFEEARRLNQSFSWGRRTKGNPSGRAGPSKGQRGDSCEMYQEQWTDQLLRKHSGRKSLSSLGQIWGQKQGFYQIGCEKPWPKPKLSQTYAKGWMKKKIGMLGLGGEVVEHIAKAEKPKEKERKLMTEDGHQKIWTYPTRKEKN